MGEMSPKEENSVRDVFYLSSFWKKPNGPLLFRRSKNEMLQRKETSRTSCKNEMLQRKETR